MIIHISEVSNGFLLVTERPGNPPVTVSYVFLSVADLVARVAVIYGGVTQLTHSADDKKKGG